MATQGRTFKECGCRDAQTGKQLGQRCPQLYRGPGRWSRTHGSWYYQLELPVTAEGKRRSPLRRGGFTTQDAAAEQLSRAIELLAIAGDDLELKRTITDLIVTTIKQTKQLPAAPEVRRKVFRGQDLLATITVGEWLMSWLESRRSLRPGTADNYKSHIRFHLVPAIGHIRLDKLRVSDVRTVFTRIDDLNALITTARESGDPVLRAQVKGRRVTSDATKQRIRATLRAALNAARREQLIDINVASLAELGGGKRPKALVWTDERIATWTASRDTYIAQQQQRARNIAEAEAEAARLTGTGKKLRKNSTSRPGKTINVKRLKSYISTPRPSKVMVWTPEQTAVFVRHARRHRLYALYHLIAFRGLRRGEACGFRWNQINWDTSMARVNWQITQVRGILIEGKPKSEAGERDIGFDNQSLTELRAHRARQNMERLAAGENWTVSDFVFTEPNGQRLTPQEVTDEFYRLSMAADLPPIRLHDLRHGAATILLSAGHDMKVVQETLGLSSITIAADTYTSVLPHLARQSAEDAAAVIRNAQSEPHS